MRALMVMVMVAGSLLAAGCALRAPSDGERSLAAGGVGGAMLFSRGSLGFVESASGAAAAGAADQAAAAGAAAGGMTVEGAYYALLRQLGGAALLAYALYDPLAPNWEIRVVPESETRARLFLTMRALTTGGQGEAWPIFRRAAQQYAEHKEARDVRVLAFEEGIHSKRPFAERYAVGRIELVR